MATSEGSANRTKPSSVGLRLQILLALGGVILVAYVPLFFAIAQVNRGTSLAYREESARTTGRAIAAHVSDARAQGDDALARVIAKHVADGTAVAIRVYDANGNVLRSAGPAEGLARPSAEVGTTTIRTSTKGSRVLDVVSHDAHVVTVVRLRTEEDGARTAGVVRAVALYMGVFALALLVFAYIALTRAIVRPIENLARAADRVANGARSLEIPSAAAKEISELGASVRSMAAKLLDDERALRAKVDELTTTTKRLSDTREQLAGSEHLASVGKLAAGVAHEIGNPIAAIMGMHDLIEDGSLPNEDRSDFLRRMRKETERINVVVRDLLDYARPESIPPGTATVANVDEILTDALNLVRPQKDWRSIDVKVDTGESVRATISPQRLTQVLLNLLLNASAAMAKSASRSVTLRTSSEEGIVRIVVEDTGPGVPESLRAKIFDPFVTTKDVGAGTGLGLSVCRGIVESAGGRIFVDPNYDRGARFVIELPAAP